MRKFIYLTIGFWRNFKLKLKKVYISIQIFTIRKYFLDAYFAYNINNLLAVNESNGAIQLIDIKTEKPKRRLSHNTDHNASVNCVAFGNNGILASGSDDTTIRLWNTKTGNCIRGFGTGHKHWVSSLAFDKNEILATGSNDRTINLRNITFDITTNIRTLTGHNGPINFIAFTNDDLLISGSGDRTINIRNFTTRKIVKTLNDLTKFNTFMTKQRRKYNLYSKCSL